MKTNEKMASVSKALSEVWEWKESVYKDIKNMTFEEKRVYFEKGFKEAVEIVKGKIKVNSDGSYSIVKIKKDRKVLDGDGE
ncbi:MAG: hypothetical protein FJ264_01045 [Planctomycetes bacterium]|nr:hypothetical protein [Planctomycetota bacterium]